MLRFKLNEPETIIEYATKLEDFWQPRNETMKSHEQLYRLQPTVAHKDGHTRITDNTPWVVVSFAASLLATKPVLHRIPYTYGQGNTTERESRSGQLERFLIGIWRMVDREQARRRRAHFALELATWSLLRGWIAGVAAWTGEAPNPYHIRLWDPYHVYPDPDIPGLIVRRYRRSLASVIQEYPKLAKKFVDKDYCEVVDLWYERVHGTLIDDQWAKKPVEHGLDRPPVVILPVGGYPVRSISSRLEASDRSSQLGDNAYVEYMGQSVLFGIYDLQKYRNLVISQVADAFSRWTDAAVIAKMEDGIAIDIDNTPGTVTTIKPHEDIRFERPNNLPADLSQWLGAVTSMIDRGTFPNVMYGATPHELSGFARAMVHNAGTMRIIPYAHACETFYREADGFMLEQLEKHAAGCMVDLRGTDYQGNPFREMVDLYELAQIVGGDHEVEPEIKPFMPQDRMGNVAMSGQLRQQNQWSRKTVNEKLFAEEIQDPLGEERRIAEQIIHDNPAAMKLMAESFAPVVVLREARRQLEKGEITEEEYELVHMSIQNQFRIQRGAESRAIAEVEAPMPMAPPLGMPLGPGGVPQEAGAFPPGQVPTQEQVPPEMLAPQLQGSPSPGEGGP